MAIFATNSGSVAMAAGCWEWNRDRVGHMDRDGGFVWVYDFPPIKLPSKEEVKLQVVLRAPDGLAHRTGTEIEWNVPQLTSSLAPIRGGKWRWRAPDSNHWIFEPPFATIEASLLVLPEGSGCVTSAEGWRFFYRIGSLYRIMSPSGVVLRVVAMGQKIHRIEIGSASRPTVLLAAHYSAGTGRIQGLETPDEHYSFLSSDTGAPLALIDQEGVELLRLSYTNRVLSSIVTQEKVTLPIEWRKLSFLEKTEKDNLKRDFVLKAVGTEQYKVTITQGSTIIQMKSGDKKTGMIYNHYNQHVQYGELP